MKKKTFKTICIITVLLSFNFHVHSQRCEESSYPRLGPSALRGKSCNDIANPSNLGTLDCRTDDGGYSEQQVRLNNGEQVTYGVYRITGSTKRYDGTRTRVERSFNTVKREANMASVFTAKFVIDDLSDGNTCIIQSHAGGEILSGLRTGQDARSAVFLLYAKKTSNSNVYELELHESTVPFTTSMRGERTRTFFRNIDKGVEYNIEYTTGYDASSDAYTTVKVFRNNSDTETAVLRHTYASEDVNTRYGAYETSDSNDLTATIKYRDTRFCRVSTVINVNASPSVTITAPQNGDTFEMGTPIALKANASDPDGNLEKVNFKINGDFYKTDTARPFENTFTPTEPGTYEIAAKVFDKEGLTKEVSVTIEVEAITIPNRAPEVNITSPINEAVFTLGEEIILSANATDPDGNLDKVNFKVNGEFYKTDNQRPFENSFTPEEPGTYRIAARAFDQKGLSVETEITITVNATLSNDDFLKSNNSIKLYPSPTKENINLTGLTNKNTEVSIIDISGKTVLNSVVNKNNSQISVAAFANGIYFMKLNDNTTQKTMSFIKN